MRLITSCLLLAAALPAMAQIYQYTDANGNKVFTNQPPDGVQAQTVELQPTNTVGIDTPEKSSAGNAPAADSEAAAYEILALSDLPTEEALRANITAPSTSASASARPCTAATSCNWCWTANPTARPAAAPASPCTRSTAATTASRYRYSTANGCCNPARR